MCNKLTHFIKKIFYLAVMTLEEAFIDLINSEGFKEITRRRDDAKGVRYRIYLSRFRKGKLGKASIIEILEANGYEIRADKVEKKNVI